jgi:hypothetical protein
MSTTPVQELEFLCQADFLKELQRIGTEAWLVANSSSDDGRSNSHFFSALIPNALIKSSLERTDWDLGRMDTGPCWWTGYKDGKEVSGYSRLHHDNGIEPLVIWRVFHGMRDGYTEVCEEFRLFHNLYHDGQNRRFLKFNDAGNEEAIIEYDGARTRIKLHALREFAAAKECHVAAFFESVRWGRYTLEGMGCQEERRESREDLTSYGFVLCDAEMVLDKEKKSLSRIMGKKLIPPATTKAHRSRHADDSHYPEFIIGQNESGELVRFTCDDEKLANYFGKNPEAPHYLTPVFFRREVLQKYYSNPAKYSVEDAYLRCGSLWGLRLDNDHPRHVTVFLGDLGRDLPAPERDYWKSFNIPPDGPGISDVNWKRGFMCEFTDPTHPELKFKSAFEHFQRRHQEQFNWTLFKALEPGDEHFLTTLRVPLTDDQAEFDAQVLALTKVLIDSINEKQVERGLTLAAQDRGITKLEKYLNSVGVTDIAQYIKFLRSLQELRSVSVAHRKGKSFAKIAVEFGMDKKDRITVFEEILASAVAFMEFLHKTLLPPDKHSPPSKPTSAE